MLALRRLSAASWIRIGLIAVAVYLVIGIPTDVVPNPIFGRSSIPVRWWDPPLLAVTALLTALVLGLRPADVADSAPGDRPAVAGSVMGLLAVGCPTCNQLVVLALGTSGALSWFQPVQPLLGVAAVGVLVWALRRRLDDLTRTECPVPAR